MAHQYQDTGQRSRIFKGCRRVVIKVGTQLLAGMGGVSKADRIGSLVDALARVRARRIDVILVSSGAIGAGMTVLGTSRRPALLPLLQAHAAVGQSRLMYHYETACARHGFHCAQLLLTAADVQDRERHLNVTSCLDALLGKGVLPVINENDSVSVDEIRFGDNDILAALVATMVRADLTVFLTNVDGMHDPNASGAPRRLSVVPRLSGAVCAMAGGTDGNPFSVGGMTSKLRAAELLMKAGENLWIADGHDFAVLDRVFAGDDVGTLFQGASAKMASHKRFLAFFSTPDGDVVADPGAVTAVTEKGRSLLPSGIVDVRGDFARGDTVRIVDLHGKEVARGVTNYGAADVARIRGARTDEVGRILGTQACYEEVVHRNYLVLTR